MAQRTIKAVVTTYIGTDGVPRAGLRGETVEVSDDSVKAFDEGEAAAGSPAVAEPEPKADESPKPARKSSK